MPIDPALIERAARALYKFDNGLSPLWDRNTEQRDHYARKVRFILEFVYQEQDASMTPTEIQARTLNDDDLAGFARRVANNAISSAEVDSQAAVYCGHLFRDHVVAEALMILKAVVTHERRMALQGARQT